MRVLYCFDTSANSLAVLALANAPKGSVSQVRTDAPWEELADRWDGSSDLVLIGQDTEIHDCVIREFQNCSAGICIFMCEGKDHGLHCIKFSSTLQLERSVLEVQLSSRIVCLHLPPVVCERVGFPEVGSITDGDLGFGGEKLH